MTTCSQCTNGLWLAPEVYSTCWKNNLGSEIQNKIQTFNKEQRASGRSKTFSHSVNADLEIPCPMRGLLVFLYVEFRNMLRKYCFTMEKNESRYMSLLISKEAYILILHWFVAHKEIWCTPSCKHHISANLVFSVLGMIGTTRHDQPVSKATHLADQIWSTLLFKRPLQTNL